MSISTVVASHKLIGSDNCGFLLSQNWVCFPLNICSLLCRFLSLHFEQFILEFILLLLFCLCRNIVEFINLNSFTLVSIFTYSWLLNEFDIWKAWYPKLLQGFMWFVWLVAITLKLNKHIHFWFCLELFNKINQFVYSYLFLGNALEEICYFFDGMFLV